MSAFAFNLVKLNTVLLYGIAAPNLDLRQAERALATDGTLHQTGASVIRTAPKAGFSTIAMRTLFTTLGTGDEVPFLALDGTNGLELIGNKANATAPGYDATAVHASRKIARGDLYLSGVSWTPGDVARAEVEVFGISANGTTDPVAATTAALTAPPQNTEQLVLSSLVLNALALTKVASFDLRINHQGENNDEEQCYTLGLPHPTMPKRAGAGGATEVILTIETLDLTGTWTNGTVVATFTQTNDRGVGLDTETAIITLNNPTIRETIIRGADGASKRQIVCRALFDGTNKPVTITTA